MSATLIPLDADVAPTKPRRKRNTVAPLPPSRLLSAQDAAVYTGWPYTTLRDAAIRGHLPVVKIPGSRRMWFDRKDLDRAIESWKERRA
jgi:excisionase family DNA binding protein